MGGSVKEKVIALAQGDPFLTIEELAQLAETTARYVRTILSEADLSLNQMRRDYARHLERRLGQKHTGPDLTFNYELQITQISACKVSSLPVNWSEKALFQASAVNTKTSIPSYVQLITPECLTVRTDYSSLRELLPGNLKQLEIGEQRAEIVLAPVQLSSSLGLPKATQMLKLTTVIHKDGKPIALELHWLALDGLVLEWSKENPELKVLLTG